MALRDIRFVASYERKLIVRNKLFWIFTVCVMGGIAFQQWMLQGGGYGYQPWLNVALPSSFPYYNAWLFNLLQGVIGIFIGIDYVWRDRRLETNDVFAARPVSNVDYLLGKMLGIFESCVMLNVMVIGLGMGLHVLTGEEGTFQPGIYLFYLLTLTIPTLIFVLGVSLMVAQVVKSHALAILCLLMIFALCYFGTSDFAYGIWDPWGRRFSLLFSDVTGLTGRGMYLLHRGMYLSLGIGLLLLSIGRMKRLSNKRSFVRMMGYAGVACVLLGVILGTSYTGEYEGINHARGEYREVYEKFACEYGVSVDTHNIKFRQRGNRMHGESSLVLRNSRSEEVERLVMYLNPGLEVLSLTDDEGRVLVHERDKQAIVLQRRLKPGEELTLCMEYEGVIDERVCYLDFSDQDFHDTHLLEYGTMMHDFYRHGGDYARVGDDYTLLLSECLWYPVCMPPVNRLSTGGRCYDYTLYTLSVEDVGDRVAISQGTGVKDGNYTRFTNREALPCLSLCVGNYVRRGVMLDSLELEMYYFPGHDFFRKDYTLSVDSVKTMLNDVIETNFNTKGGNYPYRKLAVVETPVNFVPFQRKGSKGSEFVMPEMIYVSERMYTMYYMHVSRMDASMEMGDMDYGTFEQENSTLHLVASVIFMDGIYDIYPMFNDFRGMVTSDKYPGINGVFGYILHAQDVGALNGVSYAEGMDDRESSIYWSDQSIFDALNDEELPLPNLLYLLNEKYKQIGLHLGALVGENELLAFMKDFMNRHRFQRVEVEVLCAEFRERFGKDMEPILNYYYEKKELPVLFVSDMKTERFEGDEVQFLASCKVYNPSSVDGVLSIDGGMNEEGKKVVVYNYIIPAGSCKEIRTRQMGEHYYFVKTNLCRNIPREYTLTRFDGFVAGTRDDRTGIWDADSAVFTRREAGIVVDNEDGGFVVNEKKSRAKLAALFSKKNEKKYSGIYGQEEWTLIFHENYYGEIIRSAYFRLAGNGKSKVEWNVNISQPGKYEVFAYIPKVSEDNYGGAFVKGARLFYEVGSRRGVKNVELVLDDEQPGWISLGIHDFDGGKYRVSLSDKGGDKLTSGVEGSSDAYMDADGVECKPIVVQYIYADAVKWVPVGEKD